MKLTLIFLSIFVAISHQQYYRNPRMMFAFPWLAVPFSQEPVFFGHNYDYAAAAKEDVYPVENNQHIFTGEEDEEQEELEDIQSRIKGRYRPRPSFQDKQNARFLFNLFASTTGTFNNPLLKTATFTLTQTLTLASIVTCVPANNFLANGVPPPAACRRKRNFEDDDDDTEGNQFPIAPSETLGLIPTVLSSSHDRSLLSSSRDDEMSASDHYSRDKRFFINKNQFVVSSTLTTFAFVNTTVTVTVNLIPAAAAAAIPCVEAAAPPAAPAPVPAVCVACLPAGFIVCP